VPLPVVLDLTGVRWCIIGGGKVAERKLAMLLRAGAEVEVVAPRVTDRIRHLSRRGRVRWRRATYRPAHLKGSRFVLAASSDSAINRSVARDARRRGSFVGVADDPSLCTMFMPAVLRRGDLLIAVSTRGRSPGLAGEIRDALARRFGPEYASLVRIVASIRGRLRKVVSDPRARARRSKALPLPSVLRLLRTGRRRAAWRAARLGAGLKSGRRARDGGAS
jgi:precorrin-2 dehydrogenase/sirohydrochlorin ferrochelatase